MEAEPLTLNIGVSNMLAANSDPPHDTPNTPSVLSSIPANIGAEVSQLVGEELTLNEALPGLVRGEGTALLLDISSLFYAAKANNFSIDYGKLRNIFRTRCDLRYCGAFSAVDNDDVGSMNWLNFMQKTGYSVTTKDLQRYVTEDDSIVTKGNMDIEIAIAAMKLSDGFGHVIIGTCDGDFIPLIETLREGNFRKVSVLGMGKSSWAGMNNALIRAADNFYDMSLFKEQITYHGSRIKR